MELIEVTDAKRELSPWHYGQIEKGQILFFPEMPVELPDADCRFLLRQRQTEAAYHKNIAYRPVQDTLTGAARGSDRDVLRRILRDYSRQATELLRRLLPRYGENLRVDFTSFRPFEEEGREMSVHSRNDLLHVDSFPTRPTNGDRILRFFTNLNPEKPRVWLTSEPFDALARLLGGEAGLVEEGRRRSRPFRRLVARVARGVRLHQFAASPYDAMMHRFHNFLKENRQFQENCSKHRLEFPPGSSWLVFTDMVSHAVLSGQFALEQTFVVPRQAMLEPEQAPVSILERLTGFSLTWPD